MVAIFSLVFFVLLLSNRLRKITEGELMPKMLRFNDVIPLARDEHAIGNIMRFDLQHYGHEQLIRETSDVGLPQEHLADSFCFCSKLNYYCY